jgi:hypothetical protein
LAFLEGVYSTGRQIGRGRVQSLYQPDEVLSKKLDESLDATGLKIVNVEGQPFDPGIAASAINIGDFGPDDSLVVDQMVEPIIMGPGGLKKSGTVMLRRIAA